MKMLTGLLPPSAGEALLFGQAPRRQRHAARAIASATCRSRSPSIPNLRSGKTSIFTRTFFICRRKRRRYGSPSWSDSSALTNYLDQRTLDLPLGIRQRLSLAIAIVHEPEILILDEPTSGVDPARARPFLGGIDRSIAQSRRDDFCVDPLHERGRTLRPDIADGFRPRAGDGTSRRSLIEARGAATLEDAFISYLEAAIGSRASTIRGVRQTAQHSWIRCDRASRIIRCSACSACSPIRSARRWN